VSQHTFYGNCTYPKKGSTIGDITVWFAKEVHVLPNAIAKANKNFIAYCLFGVLKMLQELAQCSHVKGLEPVMAACDASIFIEVPEDVVKLSAPILKKWWSSYGLPYVIETVRLELEVSLLGCVVFLLLSFIRLCCRGEAEGEGYALVPGGGVGPSHAGDGQHCLQEDTKAAWDAAETKKQGVSCWF
jgi:hypothetical protein